MILMSILRILECLKKSRHVSYSVMDLGFVRPDSKEATDAWLAWSQATDAS